ncbi:amidohydrolase family protein [Streptomyces mirabilis]|uniref:amidohydrolase family protein n=1 Tax=Streptomyces mirabilis TaxID=68239 RepID=UPI00369160AD
MNEKIAITHARVFDGSQLSEPRTVVIDGPVIGSDSDSARVLDADGAVLLPGLIDAHVHLHDHEALSQLATAGVTTGLEMGAWSPGSVASLRNQPGVADMRSAGIPAIGPGGMHAKQLGFPEEAVVTSGADFVAARVAQDADYIKIVLEGPGDGGPTPETAHAVVEAARAAGKLVIAHATTPGAYQLGLEIGVDIITHAPNGDELADEVVQRLVADGRSVVPTLVMMEAMTASFGRPDRFAAALSNVAAMYEAGVPIIAGSDSHPPLPDSRIDVAYGTSLHYELELLVRAGLSTVDALRAATSLPAKHFGLSDRGAVQPGLRADLVLINGDPIADIRATRQVVRVWCAGVEHKLD